MNKAGLSSMKQTNQPVQFSGSTSVERLWRTVKQEEVYIRDYVDGLDAHRSLEKYFGFYNEERLHSSLGYISPGAIYRK